MSKAKSAYDYQIQVQTSFNKMKRYNSFIIMIEFQTEIERSQMKHTKCSCCPWRFNYFWNWSFRRKFIWARKRVQRCIFRFWWVITFCSTRLTLHLHYIYITFRVWFKKPHQFTYSKYCRMASKHFITIIMLYHFLFNT